MADRLGFVTINSDWVRKELAGVDPQESAASAFGAGLYTPEWSRRTYEEMLRRARLLLAMGESVVLDATWGTASSDGWPSTSPTRSARS